MNPLLEKYIAKVESKKGDGKEWIEMMKQANGAGFVNMKSPEDFIAGKNHALTEVQSLLPELIKEVATEIVADLLWEVDSPNPSMLVIRNKLVARLASLNDVIKDWDKQADDLTNGREPNIK